MCLVTVLKIQTCTTTTNNENNATRPQLPKNNINRKYNRGISSMSYDIDKENEIPLSPIITKYSNRKTMHIGCNFQGRKENEYELNKSSNIKEKKISTSSSSSLDDDDTHRTQRKNNVFVIVLYELYCYGTIFFMSSSYSYGGWMGTLLYTVTLSYGTILGDLCMSSTPWKNIERVSKYYHVPRWFIFCLIGINTTCANILVTGLLIVFDCIEAKAHYDLQLLYNIGINFLISEVTFTAGHYWLHHTKVGSRVHQLHHLCVNPSWTTNTLFHPIDLAVEFGGPLISMPLVHSLFLKDKFSLKFSIVLLYIWYAADHSENLNLSHTIHHNSPSQVLTIYGKYEWIEKRFSKTKTQRAAEMDNNKDKDE